MRTWIGIVVVAALGVAAFWSGNRAGGQSGGSNPNEAAIRATITEYGAALKAGDLKGILAHWAADADFTDADGKTHKGHDAIGKLFEQNLKDLKEGKSEVKISALRFLTPEVAVMEGSVAFTPKDGDVETNRFSSVWAKKEGRWLIASARDLPEIDETNVSENGVKELNWLVGDWTAEEKGTTVKLNVKADLDGKFAQMRYEIKSKAGEMSVLQVIGYDPIEGTLRSWIFDSRGGFGESLWTKEGGEWISESVGVLATGQVGSAVNIVRVTGPDSFTWKSTQREVEGQVIPDHELKYTRAPKR